VAFWPVTVENTEKPISLAAAKGLLDRVRILVDFCVALGVFTWLRNSYIFDQVRLAL